MKKLRPKRSKIERSSSSDPTSAALSTFKIPVRFSVNVVIPSGVAGPIARFLQAGTESPFRDVSEVPESLRAFIASNVEPELEPNDQAPSATFVLGERYSVDRDGLRRAKSVQREVVRLERAAEEQAAREEYLRREPDGQLAAALSVVQENFDVGVARERAEAESRAKEAEMANQFAKEFVEEDENADGAVHVSPTIQNL